MGTMIIVLIVSCLVIALWGSRPQWQRRPCDACGSYNPARARRCPYCTSAPAAPPEQG